MAAPTAPTLSLLLTTPYRLRVLAAGEFEAEAVTGLTFQVSTSSGFGTTLTSSTVTTADFEYAISSTYRASTLYVRVKSTNADGDSSWSSTLTVAAIAKPSAPAIAERGSAPQRIAVAATSLDAKTFRVTFQFSKSSTFATTAWETFIETGPAIAEYRVPSTDRRTTHYVRAKVGYIADVDTTTGEEVFWESDWSSTLTVSTGAGLVLDDDIWTVSNTKVTGRFYGKTSNFAFDATANTSGLSLDSGSSSTNGGGGSGTTLLLADSAYATVLIGKSYRFFLTAAIWFNAQTDVKFALTNPGFTSALYSCTYASVAYTSGTASVALPSRTFYYGDTSPGTVTVTQSGSSNSEFVLFVEFQGKFVPSLNGNFGLSFAPATAPTGSSVPPIVLSSTFDFEDVTGL